MPQDTKILLEGLIFPECPRWHEGKLWFSDMQDGKVSTVDLDGNSTTVLELPGNPAGLGWLPDGRILVVSMTDRRLFRLDTGSLTEVADLGKLAKGNCNDMVVDKNGRAYIGNFGPEMRSKQSSYGPTEIITVTPEGKAEVAASNLTFPNGMVITPDGRTMIVAETFAHHLTAFDIKADGSLTGRRIWAQLDNDIAPDGICLDAENAVWVANAGGNYVVRVQEGGEVTQRINTSNRAFACMLGAPDRLTMFVMTAGTTNPAEARITRNGRIETFRVKMPGAGLP